jgi:hypothetical protein
MRRTRVKAEGPIMTTKRTDQQVCVDAAREARRVLSDYFDPSGAHDAVAAIEQLLEVLDNRAVDAAARN